MAAAPQLKRLQQFVVIKGIMWRIFVLCTVICVSSIVNWVRLGNAVMRVIENQNHPALEKTNWFFMVF
jgi:hypothetical protein